MGACPDTQLFSDAFYMTTSNSSDHDIQLTFSYDRSPSDWATGVAYFIVAVDFVLEDPSSRMTTAPSCRNIASLDTTMSLHGLAFCLGESERVREGSLFWLKIPFDIGDLECLGYQPG